MCVCVNVVVIGVLFVDVLCVCGGEWCCVDEGKELFGECRREICCGKEEEGIEFVEMRGGICFVEGK